MLPWCEIRIVVCVKDDCGTIVSRPKRDVGSVKLKQTEETAQAFSSVLLYEGLWQRYLKQKGYRLIAIM